VKDPRFKVSAGGLYDIYSQVFRDNDEDFQLYADRLPDKDPENGKHIQDLRAYYRKWRTWQMSDHKPLWVAIETNFADDYLQNIVTGVGPS
jgi:hypothetical protein